MENFMLDNTTTTNVWLSFSKKFTRRNLPGDNIFYDNMSKKPKTWPLFWKNVIRDKLKAFTVFA